MIIVDIKCIKTPLSSSRAEGNLPQALATEADVPERCVEELMTGFNSHLPAGSQHLANLIQKVRSGNTRMRSLLTVVRSVSTLGYSQCRSGSEMKWVFCCFFLVFFVNAPSKFKQMISSM